MQNNRNTETESKGLVREKHSSYRIWWDGENHVARAWGRGAITVDDANAFLHASDEMAEKYGPRVNWLNDLREIETPKRAARKILAEALTNPNNAKYAFVGASAFLRAVANIIIAVSGNKNARHFSTEGKALEWLNEDK